MQQNITLPRDLCFCAKLVSPNTVTFFSVWIIKDDRIPYYFPKNSIPLYASIAFCLKWGKILWWCKHVEKLKLRGGKEAKEGLGICQEDNTIQGSSVSPMT